MMNSNRNANTKWFKTTLSPKVYSEILKYTEADFIESFQKTTIQKALDFPNAHAALVFLREIQEFEQAAKLVRLKIDALDGSNYYTLHPIAFSYTAYLKLTS
ncbi:MAG: hypothetical protein LN569_02065 [Rickettsia endosymbiont of Labidopullus appendiculatus]|nr:hypothetical protein [Rickettsia endosymbiont of Labidopullus appendiculatus]